MKLDERVRDLCTQLLRAENPSVLKTVAAEMKQAIDKYVESKDGEAPALSGESK
jgi:hypothetical protein